MIQFFAGLLRHAYLVLTFRHDGTGLPTMPSSTAYRLILAVALLVGSVRFVLGGDAPVLVPPYIIGILLTQWWIARGLGAVAASLILCGSMGIDAIHILAAVVRVQIPVMLTILWSGVAAIVAFRNLKRTGRLL